MMHIFLKEKNKISGLTVGSHLETFVGIQMGVIAEETDKITQNMDIFVGIWFIMI